MFGSGATLNRSLGWKANSCRAPVTIPSTSPRGQHSFETESSGPVSPGTHSVNWVTDVSESEMCLSEQALRETQLLHVLPTREFTLDQWGKVEIDESAAAAALTRSSRVAEQFEEAMADVEFADVAAAEDLTAPSTPFEVLQALRQEHRDLLAVRAALREEELLGNIVGGLESMSAGRRVTEGECPQGLPPGSEPPPSPNVVVRRPKSTTSDNLLSNITLSAAERLHRTCELLGLPPKPAVCRAFRMLENGRDALPQDFSGRTYLGNRNAQALFLALVRDIDEEAPEAETGLLKGLRSLELAGQGLGNDAALALAQLMPRCPGLCELNLARNHISETGALRLLQEATVHPSLVRVNLELNSVPSWVRVRLREVLAERQAALEQAKLGRAG